MIKNRHFKFHTKKTKDEVLQAWGTLPLKERQVLWLLPSEKDQKSQLYFKQGNTINWSLDGLAEWKEDGKVEVVYYNSKVFKMLLILYVPIWIGLPLSKLFHWASSLEPFNWVHISIFLGATLLVMFMNLTIYQSRMQELNAKWTSYLNARPEALN
ncbi:MAG: hypothetical protein EP332_11710 [Bacteroidetes bacterium]|nr:MAG: hypothetical protein EP332_11710 [Bacteroidota bacterium]